MTAGIVSWGVYLPYWRLQRSAIAQSLGGPAGRGSRRVASFDEDTTTMGVEAARRALAGLDGELPQDLVFSTPAPAYLDKTNATVVHAALDLEEWAGSYDVNGSVRSGVAALRAAAGMAVGRRTMAVMSDLRSGLAGGADERDSGDGAVAFVFGSRNGREGRRRDRRHRLGVGGVHRPLADPGRHRVVGVGGAVRPGGVPAAWCRRRSRTPSSGPACRPSRSTTSSSSGLHVRAVAATKSSLGVSSDVIADDHVVSTGNLGAAQPGFLLADVLDRAEVGQHIALVVVADGADVVILRVEEGIHAIRAGRAAAGLAPVVRARRPRVGTTCRTRGS